jgi:hypothetical protein
MDDNEWDVGRFDDIWSGVFLKRAADIAGDAILTGTPLCEHNKAPRPTFDDLNNEVPALELNEHVWEVVHDVTPEEPRATRAAEPHEDDTVPAEAGTTGAETYRAAFAAMADELAEGDFSAWTNGEFLNFVGEHMRDWLAALDALDAEATAPAEVAADD